MREKRLSRANIFAPPLTDKIAHTPAESAAGDDMLLQYRRAANIRQPSLRYGLEY